jgi:hypothetical protein
MLLDMEVNGYFLFIEGIVDGEQVMHCHERNRVDEAFDVEELLEFIILALCLQHLFLREHVEVSLRMPELINIVNQIPLREMMLNE